jgi:2-phospho-L-lactate guanylyltransferase
VRTIAVLPVRSFASAKQRLAAGLSPELRRALAEAMFRDVLTAVGQSTELDGVIVVTADRRARSIATEHAVAVVADTEQGHSAAALVGIAAAIQVGAERAVLVPGDCPALDARELDRLLSRAVVPPSVLIVPDRHGTGTNALVLTPLDALPPSFGPGSCARHVVQARAAGVNPEVVDVPSLATDVDTPEDLDALEALLASTGAPAATTRPLIGSLTVESKC